MTAADDAIRKSKDGGRWTEARPDPMTEPSTEDLLERADRARQEAHMRALTDRLALDQAQLTIEALRAQRDEAVNLLRFLVTQVAEVERAKVIRESRTYALAQRFIAHLNEGEG